MSEYTNFDPENGTSFENTNHTYHYESGSMPAPKAPGKKNRKVGRTARKIGAVILSAKQEPKKPAKRRRPRRRLPPTALWPLPLHRPPSRAAWMYPILPRQ